MVPWPEPMSGGHVLVIEDDEWVARLLAVGLREAGHRVTLCADGAGGITTIHREVPDCVVCDVELPDVDGHAIGRSMRQAGGRVAGTPLVYLCARDEDADTKIDALRGGGDAYLSKPFRIDEVALTVTSLIRLAERNRGISPESAPESASSVPPAPPLPRTPPPDAPDGVLEGDLAKVSVATILTVLEMEKHTGQLEMTRGEHYAQIHLSSGTVDGAMLGETPAEPIVVLRTVLTWTGGRFTFMPTKKPERPMQGRATISALLMEAARLEDEFRAGLPGREERSTLPPLSARMSDMLGLAFSSSPPPAAPEPAGVSPPSAVPPAAAPSPPPRPTFPGATPVPPPSTSGAAPVPRAPLRPRTMQGPAIALARPQTAPGPPPAPPPPSGPGWLAPPTMPRAPPPPSLGNPTIELREEAPSMELAALMSDEDEWEDADAAAPAPAVPLTGTDTPIERRRPPPRPPPRPVTTPTPPDVKEAATPPPTGTRQVGDKR